MNRITYYLSIITLFLVFCVEGIAQTVQPDAQGIIYVRKGYQGDGSSWNNALGELADALKWANDNKTQWTETSPLKIYVAKGTYKPLYTPEDGKAFSAHAQYARDRTFLLVNNVQLYGGFAGDETTLTDRDLSITTNASILSGDIGTPNDKTDNAYHVVLSVGNVGVASLNGFSVTGGYASGTGNISVNSSYIYQIRGGGMYNISSSPTLSHVAIYNNTSSSSSYDSFGGGMYNEYSNPTLTHVEIYNNTASSSSFYFAAGGGMYNTSSKPTLTQVAIYNNTVSSSSSSSVAYGGGMYNSQSSLILTNVAIYNNTASSSSSSSTAIGGGMYNYTSNPTLTNVTVTHNQAKGSSPANSIGGGIINTGNFSSSSSPKIYNSIIWGNTGWGDVENNIENSFNGSPTFYHSLIQGSGGSTQWNDDFGTNVEGNIDADPLFTDATNSDYSLQACSPAVNTGSNSHYTGLDADTKDLAGNPRVYDFANGGIIDMGAFENQDYEGVLCFTPNNNNILYVNKNVVGGNNSGDSWANAIPELADALKWVNDNKANFTTTPLQIWVAGGTYKPMYSPENGAYYGTDQGRDNTFLMVKNVQLYGGFAGTESALTDRNLNITANASILSGDIGTPNDKTDNAYHVVVSAGPVGAASLDGFSITDGYANVDGMIRVNSQNVTQNGGAGMYNQSSDPTITHVAIYNNTASSSSGLLSFSYGGGMYNEYSSPTLTYVTIYNNTASSSSSSSYGGGMYNRSSRPTLTHVAIYNNTASSSSYSSYGGGMHNTYSNPTLTQVAIYNNTASTSYSSSYGGGMYNENSSPTLIQVTVAHNQAKGNSEANSIGGGLCNWSSSSSPRIFNSIIWGNTGFDDAEDNIGNQSNSTPTFYHSLIQGSKGSGSNWGSAFGTDGAGNIDADPMFTNAANTDFSLQNNSPAIDAGKNSYYTDADKGNGNLTTDKDLAGNSRLSDCIIDMGVYEKLSAQGIFGICFTRDANNVLYVNKNVVGGNNSGDSWTNAIPELADALKWANDNKTLWTETSPLKIYVAKGTYKPMYSPEDGTNYGTDQGRDNTFLMVNNVQLYGGFAGTETALTDRDLSITNNATILSGDIGTPNDRTDNAYHVVLSSGAVGVGSLDGFSITDGYASGTGFIAVNSSDIYQSSGGGMNNYQSSPTITQVAIYNNMVSSVDFGVGGGMCNVASNPTITQVVIYNNTVSSSSYIALGGGMYNDSSSPTLIQVTVAHNQAKGSSSTNSKGGGIFNSGSSSSPKIYNSIIWGNTGFEDAENNIGNTNSSNSGFYHSLVQGSGGSSGWSATFGTDGAGNIDADPLFTDAANGDFSLQNNSPAIDAGNNSYYTDADKGNGNLITDKELAGNPRLFGPAIDMGAYENQSVQYTPNTDNILYVNQSVDQTATGYTGLGDSWTDAIPELADALKWANDNKANFTTTPLQIWVAGGTYNPMYSPEDGANYGTDQGRDNTFLMVNNVQLFGGFAGTETTLTTRDLSVTANATILSGDIGTPNDNSDNAYHVVVAAGTVGVVSLDGFSITDGYADGSGTITVNSRSVIQRYGGGMYNEGSSPILTHVAIYNNTASASSSFAYGGGMYNGYSRPTLTHVAIYKNMASSSYYAYGGGMYNQSSSPTLTHVTVTHNQAKGSSTANSKGGGIRNSSSSPKIYNSIIWGNTELEDVENNIGNENNSKPQFYHSLIQGSKGSGRNWNNAFGDNGGGNIDSDPMFTDAANGDFSLQNNSPAIDAGNNNYYTDAGGDINNDLDLAGNPRLVGRTIDMGAYENQTIQFTPDINNILYVDKNVVGGNNSGDSWTNAIVELADALKWANDNKAEWTETSPLKIYVAKGTYKPLYTPEDGKAFSADVQYARDRTFLLVNNVQLYGGFAGTETALTDRDLSIIANASILSGDIGTPNDKTDNTFHVVVSVGAVGVASLNGFSITGGYASSSGSISVNSLSVSQRAGGGMYNSYSMPTVTHVAIYNNTASSSITSAFGGGMYNSNSSPTLTHLAIYNNTASSSAYSSSSGGGVYNENSSPTLTHVEIYNNTASSPSYSSFGGGMYNKSSHPILTNVSIYNNTAFSLTSTAYGGGMMNDFSSPTLIQVTVAHNQAKGNSEANSIGGGLCNWSSSSSPRIFNSIIWGNMGFDDAEDNIGNIYSIPTFYHSLIQGSGGSSGWSATFGTDGAGNIDADPLFTDATNGDYSLQACSPAVNTGSNSHYTGLDADTKDLAGNPRVYYFANGGIIDMGGYEFQGEKFTYDNVLFEDITVAYDGTARTITASNLPADVRVSYEIKDATNTVLTEAVNAGRYTITATLSGCGADKELTATLTITKATLTAVVDENQSKVYGEAESAFTYTLTGFQGTDDQTILTGSLERAIGEDVGIYPINQGDLSAGDNYDMAFTGANFAITKAKLTITAEDKLKVYGEALPSLTFRYDGLVNGDTQIATPPVLSTTATAASSVGTYPITLTAADANYTITVVDGALMVARAALTITAEDKSKVYGEALPSLTFRYDGLVNGDTEIATLPVISTTATDASSVGTYPISLSTTDGNYSITAVDGTLTVTKAALTITAEDKSKIYGAALPNLTFRYDGLVNGDTQIAAPPLISTTATAASPVGTYPIALTAAADANYTINQVAGTLTVAQAALTITAEDKSKVYGAALPSLTFRYDGLVNGDTQIATLPVISTTATDASSVGTYPITLTAAADANYTINQVAGTLTVAQAALTITAEDKSKVYGATLPSLTFRYDGLVNGDTQIATEPVLSTTATAASVVGTYPITLTASDANYIINHVAGTLTVAQAALTITAEDKSKVYGEALPSLTFRYDGLVNGDTQIATEPVLSTTATTASVVGTYPITLTAAADANYTITAVDGALMVARAALTITAEDKSKFYGAALPSLTFRYDGLVNGDTQIATPPVLSTTATTASVVGTYPITLTAAADANYIINQVAGTLTVAKAALIGISLDDDYFVYDGTAKSLAVVGTLPAGASVAYTIDGATGNTAIGAGVHTVTATIDGGANYEDMVLTAQLTIDKADIVGLSLTDDRFVYDGTAKSLAVVGTLPVGASVTYAGNGQINAGVYTVTAVVSGANYNDLELTATLTIGKATLAGISLVDGNVVYDGSAKSLAITGTLPAGTSVAYTIDGATGNTAIGAGVHTVTATIDGGANYEDMVLTAQLTIDKADIVGLSLTDDRFVYDGTAKSLAVVGTLPVGVSVTYAGNGQINAGIYTVVAVVSGGNYVPLMLTAKLTITKAKQTIRFNAPDVLSRDAGTVALDVSLSSGLPVTLTVDDPSVATVSGTNLNVLRLGMVEITATQNGDANHEAATPVTVSIRVKDNKSELPVLLNKALSPNGDGINDFLRIEGIQDYPENKVTIFDRSGSVLAEIEGYNNREKVFTGKESRDGTYYYYLDVKDNGVWKREKGYFVIRR